MEVIDTAYSGCMKDFNTVVVAFVIVVVVVASVVVEDNVVEDFDVDLKITFSFNDLNHKSVIFIKKLSTL